jgi:tRNA (cmo5U34)-methyltransferase
MYDQNKNFSNDVKYIGIDYADGFAEAMNQRMQEYPELFLSQSDVRDYEFNNCSLITSIFTLQFVPRKDRQIILDKIYRGLNSGGGFIFSEKIYLSNSRIQDMMTFMYYDFKREHFTEADIMQKEVTLRSMLRPNTWKELVGMLNNAGFKDIQTFWQNHNFVGAIAIK